MENDRRNVAENESAGKQIVSGLRHGAGRNVARPEERDRQYARPRTDEKPVRVSQEEAQKLQADRDPDDPVSP